MKIRLAGRKEGRVLFVALRVGIGNGALVATPEGRGKDCSGLEPSASAVGVGVGVESRSDVEDTWVVLPGPGAPSGAPASPDWGEHNDWETVRSPLASSPSRRSSREMTLGGLAARTRRAVAHRRKTGRESCGIV